MTFQGDGFGYGSAMAEGTAPTRLFAVGPPAVGKMTVGREITKRTGLRLFHDHLPAELVLPFFDFGSPAFDRLVDRFRRHLIEEVAASDLPGLIFTYVWAYDLPGEQETLERYARPFQQRGGRVLYAELQASQEERLNRNADASRLSAKPSKRNIEASPAPPAGSRCQVPPGFGRRVRWPAGLPADRDHAPVTRRRRHTDHRPLRAGTRAWSQAVAPRLSAPHGG